MAVELRCPDCRAKLRLPDDPEPGSDVECPECNAVFPAPDPDTGEVPDEHGGGKKKKKKKAEGGAKKGGDKKKAAAPPQDNAPRKRKAKKKETNKTAMTLVIIGAVLFLSLVIGLLVWFFNRKPASYEMMNYLPEDATDAVGLNIGHMHKYAEFRKTVEPTYASLGFQTAINQIGKALGIEAGDVPDYMVQGSGKNGGALVIRTKKEFDPADLKKLENSQEGKMDGETYYVIPAIPKLFGGAQSLKVFAPTKRLIVFAEYNLPQPTFQNMLTGNKGGNTMNTRLGPLGKRTARGTFWVISVLDTGNKPKEASRAELDAGKGAFVTMVSKAVSKSGGFGFKASLGSRAVRFEIAVWSEGDSESPAEFAKTLKEGDLAKAQEDSSLDPPKFWKEFAEQTLGSKKVGAELFVNLSWKSSGDLFIVSSECETKLLMTILSSLVNKITGQNQGGMMMPGGGGGGPQPGGGALGPQPGAAGPLPGAK